MDPEDHKLEHGPDIGLSFSEMNLERNSEAIENLKIGDKIKFNATLISLGDKHHIHHLRTFFIEKIEGHKDVWAHANGKGRYKLKLAHLEADKLEKEANEKTKETIKQESIVNAKKVDPDGNIKIEVKKPVKKEDDDDDEEAD